MTIARTRQLLGEKVAHLSDNQVQELINQFYPLAESLLALASQKIMINSVRNTDKNKYAS